MNVIVVINLIIISAALGAIFGFKILERMITKRLEANKDETAKEQDAPSTSVSKEDFLASAEPFWAQLTEDAIDMMHKSVDLGVEIGRADGIDDETVARNFNAKKNYIRLEFIELVCAATSFSKSLKTDRLISEQWQEHLEGVRAQLQSSIADTLSSAETEEEL